MWPKRSPSLLIPYKIDTKKNKNVNEKMIEPKELFQKLLIDPFSEMTSRLIYLVFTVYTHLSASSRVEQVIL